MLVDLRGKVVVVTGGGRGIGRAIAETFLREGSCVIVTDVGADALDWFEAARTAAGVDGADEVCDVRDGAAVATMITGVAERFGAIDVLVNNAGIMGEGLVETIDDDTWD